MNERLVQVMPRNVGRRSADVIAPISKKVTPLFCSHFDSFRMRSCAE